MCPRKSLIIINSNSATKLKSIFSRSEIAVDIRITERKNSYVSSKSLLNCLKRARRTLSLSFLLGRANIPHFTIVGRQSKHQGIKFHRKIPGKLRTHRISRRTYLSATTIPSNLSYRAIFSFFILSRTRRKNLFYLS